MWLRYFHVLIVQSLTPGYSHCEDIEAFLCIGVEDGFVLLWVDAIQNVLFNGYSCEPFYFLMLRLPRQIWQLMPDLF